MAVPWFKKDLEAMAMLMEGDRPAKRCVWSQRMLTAYYGFGYASSVGFGAMVEQTMDHMADLVSGEEMRRTKAQIDGKCKICSRSVTTNGLHGRFSLWGRDEEDHSSNYWEMQNLVETIEEEALTGYLTDGELWMFTNNSVAESCFLKGGFTSKLLHKLVL
jgi:hypothetical protein